MASNIFDLFKKIETPKSEAHAPVSWILAGLGNPGKEYMYTRHNAGFLALEYLAETLGTRIDRSRFKSLCGEAVIGGERTLLMKPQTYMNASGEALREAAAFYKIPPQRILVLCDDITQGVGGLRVRRKGSDGGHNGLKSIIYQLNSDEFPRIRIGIGQKPHPDYDLAAWVLSEFTGPEQKTLFAAFGTVARGAELVLSGDTDGAMQLCNTKK